MNSHTETRELLGVYALDALDPDERIAVEAHLQRCRECASEVDQHRLVASALASAEAPAPDSIWDRVEASITVEEDNSTPANVIPFRRRALPRLMSIAAAFLVVVVAVQAVQMSSLRNDVAASNRALESIEAQVASGDFSQVMVLAASQPGAMTLTLEGDLGTAEVVVLANGTGYLAIDDMKRVDAEHVYQLWAVQSGEVISAGLMGATPSITPFHIDPSVLEGLVLTVEEAGGVAVSSQAPAATWLSEV